MVRPPESTSRLAHCNANGSGCRSGKLAKQIVPSCTRRVRAASAESVTIASRRGLDRKLSPTQTESKSAEASARSATSRSALIGMPNSTARFGKLRPNRGARLPLSCIILLRSTWMRRCSTLCGCAGRQLGEHAQDQIGEDLGLGLDRGDGNEICVGEPGAAARPVHDRWYAARRKATRVERSLPIFERRFVAADCDVGLLQ